MEIINKHKDCKFFDDGMCLLGNFPVPPDDSACKAFKPKDE